MKCAGGQDIRDTYHRPLPFFGHRSSSVKRKDINRRGGKKDEENDDGNDDDNDVAGSGP